jgi:hexulose-6-phosphate isomerase
MIKSISVWAFQKNRTLPEVFSIAREQGFPGVEVAVADTGALTPSSTKEDCARVVEQAGAAGVKIVSLASGMGWNHQLLDHDEDRRKLAVELTAGSLRVGQYLGVDTLLVVPGRIDNNGNSYDVAYRQLDKSLRELKDVAVETGVAIGIENVWNKFLLSPLEMRDFIDSFHCEKIGCYFDVGNVLINGYPEQWISILGPRIKKVHFKDFKCSVGTLDGFCDLLDGDADYPAVMDALRHAKYDGPVTAEFFDAEADLPTISSAMDRILNL